MPTLYLPIEVKRREYESQVLLAVKAVKLGFRVVLGSHAAIFRYLECKSSRTGIYLDKSVPEKRKIEWLKNHCEEIWVLDAEISPIHGRNFLLNELPARIDYASLESLDKFLVVGDTAREALSELFPNKHSKFVVSGWPRLDLYGGVGEILHQRESKKISRKYPNFLLFATSFGINRDPATLLNQRRARFLQDTPFWSDQLDFEKYSNFRKAVSILLKWDKDEDIPPIVVRPHVTESVHAWKLLLKNANKTSVEASGSAFPWLKAAKGVIHQGSTVAIEAFLMGKDCFLLDECKLKGYGEASEYVSKYICSESNPPIGDFEQKRNAKYRPEVLNNYLFNTNSNAIETIIKEIQKSELRNYTPPLRRHVLARQFTWKSLRRAAGLLRDEVLWTFSKINVHPASIAMPGGLDKDTIVRVLQAIDINREIEIRRLTLNLWEFQRKPQINEQIDSDVKK